MLMQLHWIVPLAATALIWVEAARRQKRLPHEDGGFECQPMFETTQNISVAFFLTILIWLAYVAAVLAISA